MPILPPEMNSCSSSSNGSLSDNSEVGEELQKGLLLGDKEDDICRDYLRNVCKRGKRCKYRHPDCSEAKELGRKQEYTFCHDFQNSGCNRGNCRFIHCTREEEKFFRQTGQLPARLQQAAALGVGITPNKLPLLKGEVPICKDYQKGQCMRGSRCKYRHIARNQYELETTSHKDATPSSSTVTAATPAPAADEAPLDIYTGGNTTYYPEPAVCPQSDSPTGYSRSLKRRRTDEAYTPTVIATGPFNHTLSVTNNHVAVHNGYNRSSTPADYTWLLEEQNAILRRKVEELKKQVSDLAATNEVLLEQNARYRATKAATLSALTPIATASQMVTQTITPALAVARPILQPHIPAPTTACIASLPAIPVNGSNELVVTSQPGPLQTPTIQILGAAATVNAPQPQDTMVPVSVAMESSLPPPGTMAPAPAPAPPVSIQQSQQLTQAPPAPVSLQEAQGQPPGQNLICSIQASAGTLVSYPIMSHTPIMSHSLVPNSSLG